MSEPGLSRIKGLPGLKDYMDYVNFLIVKIKGINKIVVQTINFIKYRMGKELEEEE